ncbi:HAMP domain-containing sensor histidine kinase [Gandjariella thermophila]|uniref:histidine kinase n=1 Tax=Gandjariella thermophila TaxID=1931992 RepID=A0A4D4JGE7_9PSEU|nr:HAMP domain-containing sensor histidine kinase [Gandjariella thermophila]GDY33486.1 two-component sensor histidine kinase [Gandjariella thermophila]
MSLRARVTLLAAICVAGAVALVSLAAFVTVSTNLYRQLDENLLVRAQNVVHSPTVLVRGQETIPAGVLASLGTQIDVIDGNGESQLGIRTERPPIGEDEEAVAQTGVGPHFRTDSRADYRVLAVPYPLQPGTALVIAQSMAPTKATLARLGLVLIVVSGAGVLLAAAAGTAVAQGGLRPVQRLTRATSRIARTGDLRPIPVSGDDELARLTQSFNAMLAALAESQERQRRLVADAGHELRTPLTSMRTNLELLLASEKPGAPKLSEEDRKEIYDDVRAQLDELTALIGDLVELAREDVPQAVHEPVELVEVVERALSRARRRASSSDVEFDVRLFPWNLLGDANALERAVLNLLDNAVKWSPPGGVVRVEMRQVGDGSVVLEVADAGPGIADADLPHVFDRFYRSSEARTLPGSGLGLSIVKQAAERHGGSAHAGRAPEGGALLALHLPGHPG